MPSIGQQWCINSGPHLLVSVHSTAQPYPSSHTPSFVKLMSFLDLHHHYTPSKIAAKAVDPVIDVLPARRLRARIGAKALGCSRCLYNTGSRFVFFQVSYTSYHTHNNVSAQVAGWERMQIDVC